MKFAYQIVIAILLETHTPATLTDFPECAQWTNKTDYGDATNACKEADKLTGEDETHGCCAKFSYTKIDTTLGYDEGVLTEMVQPYCLYESDRKSHASNFTDSDDTVYSWFCLLDSTDEEASA